MSSPAAPGFLEEGDPTKDLKSYRACLGQFGTGVAVVTARTADSDLAAMTINSFSSVSLDPPLVLWSIDRKSRNVPLFETAGHFVVNVLAANQTGASRHFASSGRDRAGDSAFLAPGCPLPRLAGALAHLECTVETIFPGGDHLILVGRVGRFARAAGRPLLFVQGQYCVPEPHPAFVAEGAGAAGGEAAPSGAADLVAEIFEARNRLSRRFEKHRLMEGIGLAEGRVLRRVEETPGIGRDGLLEMTFLGELPLDDALASLLSRGWLRAKGAGYVLTEEGERRRRAIRRRWVEFQEGETLGIDRRDLDTARAVLATLIDRA